MSVATDLALVAVAGGVITGLMIGWCIAAWANRITYPASEDEEPYGEANTYRRER